MLRDFVLIFGAGWLIYTEAGRKTAKNVCLNALPLLEKEFKISIIKPLKELTKEPKEKEVENDS